MTAYFFAICTSDQRQYDRGKGRQCDFSVFILQHDGASGGEIVTKAEDGIISVVGVHVASHDDTRRTSPKKGKKNIRSVILRRALEATIMVILHTAWYVRSHGYRNWFLFYRICHSTQVAFCIFHLTQIMSNL